MKLKNYVPLFITEIKEVNNIYNAQQNEFDKLNLNIQDFKKQCFIESATWGLKYWEDFLGFSIDTTKGIEERRSRLLAKIRGTGTTTKQLIKDISQAYANHVEIIEHTENYSFTIELESVNKGFPYILEDLYSAINEIKPAHLAAEYKLTSTTNMKICLGACMTLGEKITVYPFTPKGIMSKCKINIAGGGNTGMEDITIYPK